MGEYGEENGSMTDLNAVCYIITCGFRRIARVAANCLTRIIHERAAIVHWSHYFSRELSPMFILVTSAQTAPYPKTLHFIFFKRVRFIASVVGIAQLQRPLVESTLGAANWRRVEVRFDAC